MLTRLAVSGFKNLLGLDVHLGPYTCIAGPNALGKSNVFDAIRFLSLLADHDFLEAAQLLRSSEDDRASPQDRLRNHVDPRSLFWNNAESADPVMTFEVEMIVPREVTDLFGRQAQATTTFLRYSLQLRYLPPDDRSPLIGSIRLEKEELRHIKLSEAHRHLPWPNSKSGFRDHVIRGRRSGTAYISTSVDSSNDVVINLHQDGGSRGKPRQSPAWRAPRTLVSTTSTADDQTVLAARQEMKQWRLLALEPSAMRASDNALMADPHPTATGAHLAATLFRMAREQGDNVYHTIAAQASALTDVREVTVDYDESRETLTLMARLGNGPLLPARSLSDGTIRFLALCIMGADDSFEGLLCMEEPENGIHPARIETMVRLVRSLAVDPTEPPGPGNPMRQVLVNTHSPSFVRCHDDDLLAAVPAAIRHQGQLTTTVRLLPLPESWRARAGEKTVPKPALSSYLTEPPGTLASLGAAL